MNSDQASHSPDKLAKDAAIDEWAKLIVSIFLEAYRDSDNTISVPENEETNRTEKG